jgi:hypothetical protein
LDEKWQSTYMYHFKQENYQQTDLARITEFYDNDMCRYLSVIHTNVFFSWEGHGWLSGYGQWHLTTSLTPLMKVFSRYPPQVLKFLDIFPWPEISDDYSCWSTYIKSGSHYLAEIWLKVIINTNLLMDMK